MATLRGLDRINVADDIRNGHVRSGQLLDVPVISLPVFDRGTVALLLDQIAASPADRSKRVVVDFAARNHRDHVIQKIDQSTENPALGLTSQSQQNHVMARKNGIRDLRNDGVFVSDDPGKHRLVCPKLTDKIRPHFVFDRSCPIGLPAKFARSQFTQSQR